MAIVSHRIFSRIYARADKPEDLPWHRDNPPSLLRQVVRQRRGSNGSRRSALDIGCGAGVYACWLAENGHRVTAIDFAERAISMTRRKARDRGLDIDTQQADVLRWSSAIRFDLVLDAGCLHGFTGRDRLAYKERVLRWLADGGDYVLVHFDRLHRFDWRPVGPRRLSRGEILALFSPELAEVATEFEDMATPLPIGPKVRLRFYWFRHNRA